jgi:Fe-S-cluster containining protein
LSENDIEEIESFTGLAPEEFSNSGGRNGEKRFMQFKENGDCVFLKMTDGAYACSAYEARSNICKGYPSDDIQVKTCRMNSNRQQSQKR